MFENEFTISIFVAFLVMLLYFVSTDIIIGCAKKVSRGLVIVNSVLGWLWAMLVLAVLLLSLGIIHVEGMIADFVTLLHDDIAIMLFIGNAFLAFVNLFLLPIKKTVKLVDASQKQAATDTETPSEKHDNDINQCQESDTPEIPITHRIKGEKKRDEYKLIK